MHHFTFFDFSNSFIFFTNVLDTYDKKIPKCFIKYNDYSLMSEREKYISKATHCKHNKKSL